MIQRICFESTGKSLVSNYTILPGSFLSNRNIVTPLENTNMGESEKDIKSHVIMVQIQ